jgi:hypothetical protein
MHTGVVSSGVKRPGPEGGHSPPLYPEVKNAWSYTSTDNFWKSLGVTGYWGNEAYSLDISGRWTMGLPEEDKLWKTEEPPPGKWPFNK